MTDCYQCIEFGFDPNCHCQDHSVHKWGTKHLDRRYQRGEHVPNKNEAKLLRRLRAQMGLTETQLREHKKYRKMLSDAQNPKSVSYWSAHGKRAARRLLKQITTHLGLAIAHPSVVAAAKLGAAGGGPYRRWYGYTGDIENHMTNLLIEKGVDHKSARTQPTKEELTLGSNQG